MRTLNVYLTLYVVIIMMEANYAEHCFKIFTVIIIPVIHPLQAGNLAKATFYP